MSIKLSKLPPLTEIKPFVYAWFPLFVYEVQIKFDWFREVAPRVSVRNVERLKKERKQSLTNLTLNCFPSDVLSRQKIMIF